MRQSCRFEARGNILPQSATMAAQWGQGADCLSFSLCSKSSQRLRISQRGRRPLFASVTVVRHDFGPAAPEDYSSTLPAQDHQLTATARSCASTCQSLAVLQQSQRAVEQQQQQQQQLTTTGSKLKQQQQLDLQAYKQQGSLHVRQSSQKDQQCSSPLQSCQNGLAGLLAWLSQGKLLLAGAMAAVVSRTAMAPLERVKMDLLLKTSSRSALQTALWVYEREGIAGFWKGNGLNLLRTAPFKALNFFSFDVYSKMLTGVASDSSNSARFIAGAMAGITATLVCFPLDVLRTRLMAPWGHKYGGPLRTLQGMVKFEGLGALYAGCVPAVIGMAPSGAVFYGVYDLLKHNHLEALNNELAATAGQQQQQQEHQHGAVGDTPQQVQQQLQHVQQQHELPVLYTLLYGAVAGAAAETFLYPLEVIRRKMQLQSMAAGAAHLASNSAPNVLRQHGLKAASGALAPAGAGAGAFGAAGVGGAAVARIAAACTAIIQADGLKGFYAGLLPNMLQVLPSAALSYGTYETMKQLLGVATL